MKAYEVLVTMRANEFLKSRKKADRVKIEARLQLLQTHFHALSDFTETDDNDRLIDVTVVNGYSLPYWIDAADKQVKVMRIGLANGIR